MTELEAAFAALIKDGQGLNLYQETVIRKVFEDMLLDIKAGASRCE